MNRKQKIDYLKSIISGNETFGIGANYWPPLCISPDGKVTDMLTGEAPTKAQIDKADRMPGYAGYIRFIN